MNWQQIVVIVWLSMAVGIGLVQNGKPKQGYNNFWIDLLSVGLFGYLLWSGGFWN